VTTKVLQFSCMLHIVVMNKDGNPWRRLLT